VTETQSATTYLFDRYELDPDRKLLLRLPEREPVQLTSKAFQVLALLVENAGEVVSKEHLMATVWRDSFVEEANLTQTISVLRKTLGETPHQHRFIVTETGKGYRFVAPVSESDGNSADDENLAADISTEPAELRGSGSTSPYLFGVAALVVVSLVLGVGYFLNKSENQKPQPVSARTVKAIAVLPFKNIESNQDGGLLGLGMADAIITKLSQIKNIVVRQTNSVMRYADSTPEAIKVGRDINVDAVLEGNIQKAANRIRVSVRLFRVSDGALLWAENFDERDSDIFALQDSISEKVANSLSLELNSDERENLRRRYTQNIEAYRLYNKGRFFWNNRNGNDLRKSIEMFEQAIALDENYALAYSGLADSYVLLQFFSHTEKNDFFQKAKSSAEKALSIDKTLAEPHAALAMYKQLYEWDWAGAEAEFKLAIAANPNYATAHQWYGEFLSSMGRYDESTAELEKAVDLDPLSLSTNTALAQPYLASGRYSEALEKLKPALELNDRNFSLALLYAGRAYDGLGNHKEAIAKYLIKDRKPTAGGPYFTAALINSYAKDGQRKVAEGLLDELVKTAEETPVSNYVMARAFAALGYREKALEKLEKAVEQRDGLLIILRTDRNFDPIRDEPRFKNILSVMRLND
jgi:TolB-like protein/DNA-binding winged helix-turn-helix (wHTH) protein/Tfp pilus assembly protein PilF